MSYSGVVWGDLLERPSKGEMHVNFMSKMFLNKFDWLFFITKFHKLHKTNLVTGYLQINFNLQSKLFTCFRVYIVGHILRHSWRISFLFEDYLLSDLGFLFLFLGKHIKLDHNYLFLNNNWKLVHNHPLKESTVFGIIRSWFISSTMLPNSLWI